MCRLLELRTADSAAWQQVTGLASHAEQRLQSDRFSSLVEEVSRVAGERLGQQLQPGLVAHLLGVVETNAIAGEDGASQLLFPTLSLLSHSCLPSCEHWLEDGVAVVRTRGRVGRQEELTIRYSSACLPRPLLARLTNTAWHFSCSCLRCTDPTELGTRASALHCGCGGWVEPGGAACLGCGERLEDQPRLRQLAQQARGVEELAGAVRQLEQLGAHPNHHSVVAVKQRYVEEAVLSGEMTEERSGLVVTWCRDLLQHCDTLDPGLTRRRGRVLFSLGRATQHQLAHCSPGLSSAQHRAQAADLVRLMLAAKRMMGGIPGKKTKTDENMNEEREKL